MKGRFVRRYQCHHVITILFWSSCLVATVHSPLVGPLDQLTCTTNSSVTSDDLERKTSELAMMLASGSLSTRTVVADELADNIAQYRCVVSQQRAHSLTSNVGAWVTFAHHLVTSFHWKAAAPALEHIAKLLSTANDDIGDGHDNDLCFPSLVDVEPSVAVHLPLTSSTLRCISVFAFTKGLERADDQWQEQRQWKHLQLLRSFVTHNLRGSHRRLKVAFVSPDFRQHKAGQLRRAMITMRDRAKFSAILVCTDRPDKRGKTADDSLRSVYRASADIFMQLDVDDLRAASQLNEIAPHILVDLVSHNRGGRPSALIAARPAPVWVIYPDFPGTFGGISGSSAASNGIYLVTDRVVTTPEIAHTQITEASFLLPKTFFLTDHATSFPYARSKSPVSNTDSSDSNGNVHAHTDDAHAEWDWTQLTDCGADVDTGSTIVLGAFNSLHKADPDIVSRWADLLVRSLDGATHVEVHVGSGERLSATARATPFILSHLNATNPSLKRREIVRFPRRVPRDALLARMRCSSMMLDTLTLNGIATTADALWSVHGPVMTCPGVSFGSRVSASLVLSAMASEQVTTAASIASDTTQSEGDLARHIGLCRNRKDYSHVAMTFLRKQQRRHSATRPFHNMERGFPPTAPLSPLYDSVSWVRAWERGLMLSFELEALKHESNTYEYDDGTYTRQPRRWHIDGTRQPRRWHIVVSAS